MLFSDEQVELLTALKLTRNQAKIYLVLASGSPRRVTEISKAANLPKEVIYRQMPHLLEKGLVEKIVDIPSKFKATPPKEAIETLLRRRERENFDQKTKIAQLIRQLEAKKPENVEDNEAVLVLIPKGDHLLSFTKQKMETLNDSLDIMASNKNLSKWLYTHQKLFKKVAAKGVKIRSLINGEDSYRTVKNVLQKLKLDGIINIKVSQAKICAYFGIYDKKGVLMRLETKSGFLESNCLWTNNTCLLEMAQTYFETLWNKAAVYQP